MVPPVPSPKVRLIGVPPLKDVKVKVVPLMPPGAADARRREGRRVTGIAIEPERGERIAGAGDGQVGGRAGAELQRATGGDRRVGGAGSVLSVAVPEVLLAVCTPVARSMALSTSAMVPD